MCSQVSQMLWCLQDSGHFIFFKRQALDLVARLVWDFFCPLTEAASSVAQCRIVQGPCLPSRVGSSSPGTMPSAVFLWLNIWYCHSSFLRQSPSRTTFKTARLWRPCHSTLPRNWEWGEKEILGWSSWPFWLSFVGRSFCSSPSQWNLLVCSGIPISSMLSLLLILKCHNNKPLFYRICFLH